MPDVTEPGMIVNGVRIDASFAEAFAMRATALIITADTAAWAETAAVSLTGFATSIIACGVEAGIDARLSPEETPDGRPGVRVLLFAGSTGELQKQLQNRVGQCVLTSPGAACYAGLRHVRHGTFSKAGRSARVIAASGTSKAWRGTPKTSS